MGCVRIGELIIGGSILKPNGQGALIVDVETTIFQKGNPFSRRNRVCYAGSLSEKGSLVIGNTSVFNDIQKAIDEVDLLVGFNFKFDLHWLRRYGIKFESKRVWDCQVAHFLLTFQQTPFPSLEDVAGFYGLPGKLKHIEENYWSKGIDTPDIPEGEMLTYLEQDLRCTMEVYQKQREAIESNPLLRNLFRLHMDDQLVLQEMEYNGLVFDVETAKKEAATARSELEEITKRLGSKYPNTPINFNSGDQLSAFLYGGPITTERREVVGMYATGAKTGMPRYRVHEDVTNLPRLVDPPKGSELAKADKEKGTGPWSTAEDVLKTCKKIPEIKDLLRLAELSKLLDYLDGWPSLIAEKDWTGNVVHGQFNQVVARTGRLSSSNPNQQNLPEEMLKLVTTVFPLPWHTDHPHSQ